jgi:uncharacterized protein (DUF4213/DUF364 family)
LSIASELVTITTDIASPLALPAIRHIHLPEPDSNPERDAVFGLIALADESTGFFYMRWTDRREWQEAVGDARSLVGRDAIEFVTWFDSDNTVKKPLGLGAINAISQHLFRRAGYRLETAANSMGAMALTPSDHVGMVGFFPSLVQRLRDRGIPLTVIEKKPQLVQRDAHFRVTLDPSALAACTHVLCTASTLVNDTLDDILTHCQPAAHVAVIGPSAGCLPDALFARGVDSVGSSVVTDLTALLDRLRHQQSWGDAVAKYSIHKTDYAGI